MTECGNPEFRDALPDLLHGRLDDAARARAEAHVRDCGACRRELALLGSLRAAMPQPAVNVAAIAAALPAPRRRSAWTSHLWQMAAAVVFLVVGGSGVVTYLRRTPRIDSTAMATVAATTRVAAGHESAAASTSGQPADVELAVGYGYTDLTEAQLESLLKDVQDIKAVPMAEPDQSTPDVTIGNGGV
ncbi:MAG: zf-HC2 domain-containing protein [Gemmatimonadota bacterium]|nr:zf-HC2 domain-containing protein [Gemmatimonadota bacterium]